MVGYTDLQDKNLDKHENIMEKYNSENDALYNAQLVKPGIKRIGNIITNKIIKKSQK